MLAVFTVGLRIECCVFATHVNERVFTECVELMRLLFCSATLSGNSQKMRMHRFSAGTVAVHCTCIHSLCFHYINTDVYNLGQQLAVFFFYRCRMPQLFPSTYIASYMNTQMYDSHSAHPIS